jgi:hypothetical protein
VPTVRQVIIASLCRECAGSVHEEFLSCCMDCSGSVQELSVAKRSASPSFFTEVISSFTGVCNAAHVQTQRMMILFVIHFSTLVA